MQISYFSIYDAKAQMFGPLYSAPTPGAAERSFHESLSNPDAPYGKYPDDFALYRIMDFDDNSGSIVEKYEPPQLVVQASALAAR